MTRRKQVRVRRARNFLRRYYKRFGWSKKQLWAMSNPRHYGPRGAAIVLFLARMERR